jgi:hypothetical protein
MYRVGHAEVASTPPAVSNDRRLPDHPSPSNEPIREVQENAEIDSHQIRIKSQTSLHPPSAGLTRSSYMTTSTAGSRMSGLSDFPAPPGQAEVTPAHMSLFDSYFDESSSPRARDSFGLSSGSRTISRRMTFGGDEDIEDIANALSSHS